MAYAILKAQRDVTDESFPSCKGIGHAGRPDDIHFALTLQREEL